MLNANTDPADDGGFLAMNTLIFCWHQKCLCSVILSCLCEFVWVFFSWLQDTFPSGDNKI